MYYVYAHKLEGEIKYIGKGSNNGKSKSRKFSYNKYGKDQAWQLAIEWRKLNAY